jgi:hypothetical protein
MMWEKVMERFLESKPVPVMVRGLFEYALPDSYLDEFFREHAQVQYERDLAFSCVAGVLLKAVLRERKSVRSAALDDERLNVSLTSLYEKLRNVETALCENLVAGVAGRLRDVFGHLDGSKRPDPVPGLRLLTVDGNYLAGTHRRLKETRGLPCACLPGMSVCLREDRTGLITRLACREDAYTNERALSDVILSWLGEGDLLMGDRNFCTIDLVGGIEARDASFLLRHHGGLHLEPLGEPAFKGRTETGEVYEHRVRPGQGPGGPECRCVVIRLDKPTGDGDAEIVLLSNVAVDKADAVALAELYRRRWKIEAAFQEMTDHLRCEVSPLAYPKAALFGFSLAATAYNLLAALKGALASVHTVKKVEEELSSYAVADHVSTFTAGMLVALPEEAWRRFQAFTAEQMADWLRQGAGHLKWARFKKTKRAPKKPVKAQVNTGSPHRSTARLLQDRSSK